MNIPKNLLIILIPAILFSACSSVSNDRIQTPGVDTVLYNAPQPGKLSHEDFNRYHSALQSFYDTFLVAHGFNGSILVAKKGEIIFEKYHGYSNLLKKDSLNEHSAFHIASISKTFTAMATLKLMEQGKLKLDNDISTYFPLFPYNGITIKMLLSHRSSLPNYIYFMQQLGWDPKKFSSNTEVLNYLLEFKPPLTGIPGTHFTYCNTNYALLGLIIEKVSGKSYAEFLQHNFFSPLKMNDTYVFNLSDTGKAMPSYNWRGIQEGLTFLDVGFGDKNIYSTPRDLLKWDQALYNNQLFSQQTLNAAFTPYSNEKPGIKNYGYGWRMNIYPNGKKIVFHTGWWHGNNTLLIRLIEDTATIIILGNKYNRSIYDAKQLANIFSSYFTTLPSTGEIEEENKLEINKTGINISKDSVHPVKKKTEHKR